MKKLLFITIVLLMGCKSEKKYLFENSEFTINIPQERSKQIDIDSFIDSVSFVKLETNSEGLVSEITKLFFYNNKIFVVDKRANSIFVFYKDGTFCKKIFRLGRGPQEYLGLSVVNFDAQKEQIIVFDQTSNKLLIYNFDGEFEKSITNFSEGAIIRDMVNLPNGNYLCYAHDFHTKYVGIDSRYAGLWEVDNNGDYIRTLFQYYSIYPVYFSNQNFFFQKMQDGSVRLRDGVSGDLYSYNQGVINKYVSFIIDNNQRLGFEGKSDFEAGNYTHASVIYDLGNYIVGRWADEELNSFFILYDKKNNRSEVASDMNYFKSNIINFPTGFIDNNVDGILVGGVYPVAFSYYFNHPDLTADYRAKLESFQAGKTQQEIENMNPVLQILHVKK